MSIRISGMVELAESVLGIVTPGSREEAIVQAVYGAHLGLEFRRLDEALEILDQTIAYAERENDSYLLMRSLAHKCVTFWQKSRHASQ